MDSALAQTFTDFEVILVNDGSPDARELEDSLTNYFDEIVYIVQENGGVSTARNTAISEARGEYLAFLDGDDLWFPEKLENQLAFIESTDFEMIYCNALLFGEPLYESTAFMDKAPSEGDVTAESLLSGKCNVLTSATFIRKNLVVRHGMFDPLAVRIEDFDLWFRLSKNGVRIGYRKDKLVKYRIRSGGLTGNSVEKAKRTIDALIHIKDKYEFTRSESAAWESRMKLANSELSFEKGKHRLLSGNFVEAKNSFEDANAHYHNFRLSLFILGLKISPTLVRAVFKFFRPLEYSYNSPKEGQE